MTPNLNSFSGRDPLVLEAGGWFTCRVPQPTMQVNAANLLLHSARSRPANLRFAIDGRTPYIVGELRNPDNRLTLAEARERLFTAPGDPLRHVSRDEVASLLAESGYEWLQPEDLDQWQAVATGPRGCRCNLTATIVQGGVDVCGPVLATEANLAAASTSALVRFLAAAHGRIRFARFTLQDRKLHAVSFAAADRLDVELCDSVAAVVTAYGLVWREVSALTDTAVAAAYLESPH